MTSKQRAYLKGLAMNLPSIFQIGKSGLTPEFTSGIDEALEAKNCLEEPKEVAQILADRTHAEIVQVIGRKVILYRQSKEKKRIEFPV